MKRWRVRIWALASWMSIDSPTMLVSDAAYRWRWSAELAALPYRFSALGGFIAWPEIIAI